MIQSKAQAISRELFRRKVARGVIIHTREARRRCKVRLRYDSRAFFSYLKRQRIAMLKAQRDAVRNQQRAAQRAQRQIVVEKHRELRQAFVVKRKEWRARLRDANKVVRAAEKMRLMALEALRVAQQDQIAAERMAREARHRVTLLTQGAPVFLPVEVRAAIDNAFFEAEADYVPDDPFVTQHQALRDEDHELELCVGERGELREDQRADPELEHA